MITIYLGASFSEVKSKGYIGSFSCQSECAFNALHCFRHIPNNIIPCINVLIIFNCKLSSFCKSSAALIQTVPSSQLGAAYNQSSWYTHKRMNVKNKIKRNPMFWTQVLLFLIIERSNFIPAKWLVGDIKCDEIFIPRSLSIAAAYLTLSLCNSVGFLSIDKYNGCSI